MPLKTSKKENKYLLSTPKALIMHFCSIIMDLLMNQSSRTAMMLCVILQKIWNKTAQKDTLAT